MEFDGASALVTGGGSGIGRATAALLAHRGARVAVVDVVGESAEASARQIRDSGGTATAIEADVTVPEDVLAMVRAAVSAHGGLHIAVNNAGITGPFALTADCSIEEWQRTIAINLTGVFLCMRAEIPSLLENGGGAIVNTSSGAGLRGFAGLPAYVASKHGVIGLTRTAALEYARRDIRVNCVCPGPVRTPRLESQLGDDEGLAAMEESMPMGRLATTHEIAESIVWLASPEASYVTGHALAVDGGADAQSAHRRPPERG
jgi:NAD(P)-dependent dehydrogenase (short-subunit alcohol dehydrogenase family)